MDFVVLESLLWGGLPLVFLGLAEMMSERVGIINLGLEGLLAVGCFCAVAGAAASGSFLGGLACSVLCVGLLVSLFAYFVVMQKADPFAAGIAVDLIGLGATGALLQLVYGVKSLSPNLPTGSSSIGTSALHFLGKGEVLAASGLIALILAAIAWGLLRLSRFGLVLEAVGQNPKAALAAGANPKRVQIILLLLGGLLVAMAGTQMTLAQGKPFVTGMGEGRGFVALAIVAFSGGRVWRILAGSVLLGWIMELPSLGAARFSQELVRSLPFAVALGALVLVGGAQRARPGQRRALWPDGSSSDLRSTPSATKQF